MAFILANGRQQYFDDNGDPLVGGKLWTMQPGPGVTTPKDTWTDAAETALNTNPIILDARGEATVFWSGSYNVRLETAAGGLIYNVESIATGDDGLRADLASTASGKGASLIGYLRAAVSAVATTVQNRLSWLPFNAFEFMTVAQIADAQAYTYNEDLTGPLQAAMTAAYAAKRDLYLPAGGYKITGLQIPGNNLSAGKARRFRIYGDGYGEVGVIALKNAGTVLYSVTDAVMLNYTATVPGNGNGEVEIDHLALYGNSTTPIINMPTFYGLSSIHHCNIAQDGTGDGIRIGWGATYEIHNNYVVGASYTLTNLGASRTGVGIYVAQNTNSAGLATIRKCTVAGWNTCYQIGQTVGAAYVYSAHIDKCEASYCYIGVRLTGLCESATVSQCYFEGQDAGYCVLDEGNYNRIEDCFFFFSTGSLGPYTMLSSTTAGKFGGRYEGNLFYLYDIANTVGLDITSNAIDGGPGKVVSRNHFGYLAGTARVIGLRINGVDPRIEQASNDFQPAGSWTGAGTYAIRDLSTASDTSVGTAVYGLSQARSIAGNLTVPRLGRGALNLAVEPAALTSVDITAGVLTIGEMSVFALTVGSNVSITSIAAPNLPDKTFSIHVTATAFAVTFTHGALLKMAGSANLVTGANGAWVSFQIKPGGVAWETGRVVY